MISERLGDYSFKLGKLGGEIWVWRRLMLSNIVRALECFFQGFEVVRDWTRLCEAVFGGERYGRGWVRGVA